MDHARILDRLPDSILLLAPISPATRARPRLLALYRDHLSALPRTSHDAFLSGRAMVTRGMRLMGLSPRAVMPPDLATDPDPDIAVAVGQDSAVVAVWLQRGGPSLGLDLREIEGESAVEDLTQAETVLLSRQPGLARMTPVERQIGLISAKSALIRALEPRIGVFGGPDTLEVRSSPRAGISLGFVDAARSRFHPDESFQVELRVMRGRVLTRIAVNGPLRRRLC